MGFTMGMVSPPTNHTSVRVMTLRGHDTKGSKGQALAKAQKGIAKPYMVTTSTYYPSNSVVFGPGLEKLRGKQIQ